MEGWLDRAVQFIDAFSLALDRATSQLGFPVGWLIFGVAMMVIVGNAIRQLPTGQDRREPIEGAGRVEHDRLAAAPNPRLPHGGRRRPRIAELHPDVIAERARAAPADDGPAPRAVATACLIVGLALCAGAGYWIYAALQSDAQRSYAFLFGSLIVLFGIAFARAGAGGLSRSAASPKRNGGWLKDARWSAKGTGPVASERLASGMIGLTLCAAYLAPFHTLLALPWTHIGYWLLLAVLDLVFVVALVFYLRSLRSWMLGGRARLIWNAAPFRPGQPLRVRFEASKLLPAEATVELRCLAGSGGGQLLDEEPPADAKALYTEQSRLRLQRNVSGGCFADIQFQIPDSQPGSLRRGDMFICWRLVVRATLNGPDYEVSFALPLYHAGP